MLTKDASTSLLPEKALVREMVRHAQELREELPASIAADEADWIAQAAACAAPIIGAVPRCAGTALSWLESQLASWERLALGHAQVHSTKYSVLSTWAKSSSHLYEYFLYNYSSHSRKRHGVYFTPQPVADYIITQIDQLLREQFKLADGLASQSKIENLKSKICFLDPACGTGVFLLALLDHLHRRIHRRRWNTFVPDLLSRFVGIEILPAAAFLCKLNITLKLAQTGYDFRRPGKLNIITGDALSPNLQSEICNLKSAFPVLLGNPPFSSLSTNSNPWIANLVRGNDDIRGYIRANGQQLRERKTWLHDDYVKFIRLAQWHVEQAGCGIVGFVTNHGYLDNATFRLMRHELLRVFPRIQIVDLHGNRRRIGVPPVLSTESVPAIRDENIFGLDQGVAIGLLSRGIGVSPVRVEYSDLQGDRESKLAALAGSTQKTRPLYPRAPDWRFVPAPPATTHPEYSSAWSLADAMPVHTTAPVTARDHFVVAFTVEELKARIKEFRDLSIPDDEIRRRYFHRTRSARYQSGDTRGWKLAEARRIIAADSDWQENITRCLYRPFDWRYVFWHPAMIDWPRTEVTRHLLPSMPRNSKRRGEWERGSEGEEPADSSPARPFVTSPSLCLIARRQQLPTQPCTFFWIADCLALDGVIRSDNRGSESLFPLYLGSSRFKAQSSKSRNSTLNLEAGTLNSNFAPTFIDHIAPAAKLTWQPLGHGDLIRTFGPDDLIAYIYALFHSPTYRERYADSLRADFPRILPPKTPSQFVALCRFGRELINLHLLRIPHSAFRTPHLPREIAAFRAGGYPALRKWLQPKHRLITDPDYTRISQAIARTLQIMAAIDAAVIDS